MIEHLPCNDISQRSPMLVNLGNEKVYLDVEETLGEGTFGIVTRAVDNRGVSFAVKNVLCKDIDTYESVAQEVEILLKLKHPNIVAMYGFDFLNSTAVLIMEFCGQGTLNKRLDQPVIVTVQLQWMEQLRSAMTYLHGNNIVHRDLKTENVLLSENNDVKIADFGIARHFVCCRRGKMDKDTNNYIPEYLDAYMGTFAGTPFWVAPEVFDNHYTEKADIFSLGVIFYAICERQYCVFQGERYYGAFTKYRGVDTGIGLAMFEQQQPIEPIFIETQSKKLKTFICSMVHFNPDNRISLIDICNDINETFLEILQIEDSDGVTEIQSDNNNQMGKRRRGKRGKQHGGGRQGSGGVILSIERSDQIMDDKHDKLVVGKEAQENQDKPGKGGKVKVGTTLQKNEFHGATGNKPNQPVVGKKTQGKRHKPGVKAKVGTTSQKNAFDVVTGNKPGQLVVEEVAQEKRPNTGKRGKAHVGMTAQKNQFEGVTGNKPNQPVSGKEAQAKRDKAGKGGKAKGGATVQKPRTNQEKGRKQK